MDRSLLRLQVLGVPVDIQWSWLAFALAFGLLIHGFDALLAAWVVMATIAVLVHEAGHAAVMRSFGGSPRVILLASGGMTVGQHLGARRDFLLAAAGPVAGFVLGGLMLGAASLLPASALPAAFLEDVILVTIGWSAFNLLPLGGLDGRTALDSLVTVILGRPAPDVGRIVGTFLLIALLLGTALAGQYAATFLVAFVVLATVLPLGRVGRLLGGAGGAVSGSGLLLQGRTEEALAWSEAQLARDPGQRDASLIQGEALRQLTRWDEAEAVYASVLARYPGSPYARAGRSMARRALGHLDDARADQAILVTAAASDPDAVAPAALALWADLRYADAAQVLDEALSRPDIARPTRERLAVLRAVVHSALGESELALAVVDERLAGSPDDVGAHEVRAHALLQLGRIKEARLSARRALAGAPAHPELLETLALIERIAGEPETALPRLVDAATRRPNLPRARAEMSACFTQLGRTGEAEAALDGIPAWAAGDPNVTYARGCLDAACGRDADAAAAIERAARIRPALGRIARWDPLLEAVADPAVSTRTRGEASWPLAG